MEISEFEKLLNEIIDGIKCNKRTIEQAINEELSKGNFIKTEKIIEIIEEYKKENEHKQENEKIAVCFDGKPEITITYILDSIIYNNNVTLCINGNKIINKVLINIILESFINCKIKNKWINYDSNFNEIYLKDNEKYFDKIVYIGDFFEYERFKSFFKKEVEYNNYGYIKLFMDKSKYKEEYNKIMKYTYVENIYLEVYNDIQDFINESKKEDFAIVYVDDFKLVNQIQKELKAEELLVNNFPYENYKFKIKR